MAAEHGPGGAAAVTVGRQVAARLGLAALPAAVVTGARVIAGRCTSRITRPASSGRPGSARWR